MLTVYLAENIRYLFLCQPFGIKNTGKPITFLFLISQNCQYLRMEVPVTVSRNAKLQFPAASISGAGTIAVTLVTRIFLHIPEHTRPGYRMIP